MMPGRRFIDMSMQQAFQCDEALIRSLQRIITWFLPSRHYDDGARSPASGSVIPGAGSYFETAQSYDAS